MFREIEPANVALAFGWIDWMLSHSDTTRSARKMAYKYGCSRREFGIAKNQARIDGLRGPSMYDLLKPLLRSY